MDPSVADNQPDSIDEEDEPLGRHRNADLVEEARIARAGGGALGVSPIVRGLVYLTLVGTLVLILFWEFATR